MKLLLLIGASMFIAGTAMAQNDDCALASPIAGTGTFAFTTVGATDSGAQASCNNLGQPSSDAWFAWTPATSGDYTVRSCNPTFDIVLAVRDACGGVELGCDDLDGCGLGTLESAELFLMGLTGGTTYLVQIDGWDGVTGTGDLEILPFAPLPGDDCATAIPLMGAGPFPTDNTGALDSGTPAACVATAGGTGGSDIWYSWMAPASGDYTFRICDASYDVTVAVYDGCGGAELGCGDANGCGTIAFTAAQADTTGLVVGTNYLIKVDGWVGEQGTGTLEIIQNSGPTPIGTSYCLSTPNSSGNASTITAVGSTSIASQALALNAVGMPGTVNGIFFYGTGMVSAPFGDGFLCVNGANQRLPFNSSDSTGLMTEPDVYAQPMPDVPISATTLFFQAWFRDGAAGGAGFNLSDGVMITFLP